jgi:putative ABC transport system permease protein
MLKHYLKIAFRIIKSHKGYSFINIASLALGMACCFLISALIIYELSYDNFHENSANIYRVNRDVFERGRQYYVDMTPNRLMQALIDEYPEHVYYDRIRRVFETYWRKSGMRLIP